VTDFTAPTSIKAVEALRDLKTRTNLLKYAAWFATPAVGAEDLLSEAMLLVCDPKEGRPWVEDRGSFSAHMRIVIRDLGVQERRKAARRLEVGDPEAVDNAEGTFPAPDQLVAEARNRERLERLGAVLRERIAHSERTAQVFDCACEGLEKAEEIAARVGCTVAEVYDSNRQIGYHAGRILAEERAAEKARMKALRERGKNQKGWTS
jgi:DNA-directed RNA polymerase specialized sigma24 family protein